MTTLHNDAIIEMVSAIRSLPGQYELIGGGSESALRDHATEWVECGFTPAAAQQWWDAGCFDADSAESLRDAGLTAEQVATDYPEKIAGAPVSWGYAVSNGDASVADACESLAD